ncbi:hypothetical protein P7K49_033964 [Saguinus oedipus]|uniref:Uncharacterized protein n=1 Tax=Saguinus oedipus TaxID=9490 RepID=A0ABQ9TV72_SAGOE|nr:hypothetical protein P7K49_033964 [Saguinus oedipus]
MATTFYPLQGVSCASYTRWFQSMPSLAQNETQQQLEHPRPVSPSPGCLSGNPGLSPSSKHRKWTLTRAFPGRDVSDWKDSLSYQLPAATYPSIKRTLRNVQGHRDAVKSPGK